MKTLISSRWIRVLAVPLSALLMGAGLLFSQVVSAQMTGSPHDFSAQAWAGGEICVVCHTPHNAYTETEANAAPGETGPLWNRTLTAVTNYATYASLARTGSDLEASTTSTIRTTASGVSKLCLSCHDGTIAIDSFGRNPDNSLRTGTTFVDDINANANIGEGVGVVGDLSNDHPVAFQFPTTDPEIADGSTGSVGGTLPLFGALNDQMECATCHDVHATGTFGKLLRVDNNGSGLCLTCHTK